MTETFPRHQPAGSAWQDFRSPTDRTTHLERINPVAPGQSVVDGTGMAGVPVPQPIQTYNGIDVPIVDQFPAPAPDPERDGFDAPDWPTEDL